MTKITLEINGVVITTEFDKNDLSAPEIISKFCSMLYGHTFLLTTIEGALEDVADDIKEEMSLD